MFRTRNVTGVPVSIRYLTMLVVLAATLATTGCTSESTDNRGYNKDSWTNLNPDAVDTTLPDGALPEGVIPDLPGNESGSEGVQGDLTVSSLQQDPRGLDCEEAIDEFINLADDITLEGLTVVSGVYYLGQTLRGQFVSVGDGPFNGIQLAYPAGEDEDGNEIVVPEYVVGDVLKITGDAREAFCMTGIAVTAHEKTGEGGQLPTPSVVTSAQVQAFGGPDAESYESIYVEMHDVVVTDVNVTNGTFSVDEKVVADDSFQHGFYPKVGCHIKTLRGVLHYSFGEYELLPLSAADIVPDTDAGCEMQGGPMTINEIQSSDESVGCNEDSGATAFKGVSIEESIVASEAYFKGDFNVHYLTDGSSSGGFSGIQLRLHKDLGLELHTGDRVRVEGAAAEYFCMTQFQANLATVLDSGNPVPAPVPVTLANVNSVGGTDAEAYESVLVEYANVVVGEHNDYGDFYISDAGGGTNKILVDGAFHHEQSPPPGCLIKKIAGFVAYSYGEYEIAPRDAADFTFEPGSSCETTVETTTIQDLQSIYEGMACDANSEAFLNLQDGVRVEGVIVTSPRFEASSSLHGYFIMELAGGAGILMVVPQSENTNFAKGAILDVEGDAMEYYCMTQLEATKITEVGTHQAPIPATAATLYDFMDVTEAYEGRLIVLEGVEVINDAPEHGAFTITNDIEVGNLFFQPASVPTSGTTISTLRAIVRYAYGHYILEPRDASDLVL